MLHIETPDIEKLKVQMNIEGLIEALRYHDSKVRRSAALSLGELRDSRGVEPLIAALKDENPFVRKAAALALGEIGDSRAARPLVEGLKEAFIWARTEDSPSGLHVWVDAQTSYYTPQIRTWHDVGVMHQMALRKIGSPTVEPLAAELDDGDLEMRRCAAKMLGQMGDVRAVGPLIEALGDVDYTMRLDVVRALDSLGWKPDNSEAGAAYWTANQQWDKCVEIGRLAVEPLIVALRFDDQHMRGQAAGALGKIRDPRAVEPLIWLLQGGYDYEAQRAAADALGSIGDPRAVAALKEILIESGVARKAAATALRMIRRSANAKKARHRSSKATPRL